MQHTQSRFPELTLDGKRIAATSTAIALHVLVLMLLMLPTQISLPPPTLDNPLVVVPIFRHVQPITKMPVTPLQPRLRPVPRPVQQPTPDAVDDTPAPVDTVAIAAPVEPETIGADPAPVAAFAQISADVAPTPPYPIEARRRGMSGVVTLRVRVDAQGRPVEATVETSSGSRLLDEAARKFVLARWHFIAASQGGTPVEAIALIPINFVIEK